jgi:hypothetical protein
LSQAVQVQAVGVGYVANDLGVGHYTATVMGRFGSKERVVVAVARRHRRLTLYLRRLSQ